MAAAVSMSAAPAWPSNFDEPALGLDRCNVTTRLCFAASAALVGACAGLILIPSNPAAAQQQSPAQAAPQNQQTPPQYQESGDWPKLPKMVLERQFAGPLQDTVIQRLRDTVDGTVCYLYLPISAPHSPTTATGFVQYGPNSIGTISCMPGKPAPAAAKK
jgi:hypothetical protein